MSRSRDERGATVVLVALLSVSLLLVSGFVVDFGQAYVSKRNLQKAADAGALAGAQALTKYPGTCSHVISNSTAINEAHDAADEYGVANYDTTKVGYYDSTETEFSVTCDPALKVLLVKYGLEGDTPSHFGPLAGGDDTIVTTRRAEATVDVSPGAKEGVRPLAFCSAQVSLSPPPPTYPFLRLDYPKNSVKLPSTCPAKTGPGNWWTLDCPDEGPGEQMKDQVLNGCANPVMVVPGQEDTLTPGELTVVLEGECDSAGGGTESCMSGDTGNIDAGQVVPQGWFHLVEDQTVSLFPVFCAPPQCSDSTSDGSGTNATYPVYKMISAVVCGYHFSASEKKHSTSGECAGLPVSMQAGNDPSGNSENYLVIKYINERTSGSNVDSECALGDDCDGGLRRTRLTQ